MDNSYIEIQVDQRSKTPFRVKAFNPDFGLFEMIGEFEIRYIPYLWGMLDEYAKFESLELKDLHLKLYDFDLQYNNIDFLTEILLYTYDNERWIDVPERFKYCK